LTSAPGKILLDVGCGVGGPALRIAAITGCSVVGVDVHEQAIATAVSLAAQRGFAKGAKFHVANASGPLPFSEASFDAITCLDSINHLPDRRRIIADWARVLKPGRRLLFTAPVTVTGALTYKEIAVRSLGGLYVFAPHGYDESIIAQCELRLLRCEDVTANMAKVAGARRTARALRSAALREIEGGSEYGNQQEFLAVAARAASEGRLSRFLYVSEKV